MSTQGLPPQGSQPPQLPPVPPRVRPSEGEASKKKGVEGTASPANLQGRDVVVQGGSETTGTASKTGKEFKGRLEGILQNPAAATPGRAPGKAPPAPPSRDGRPSLPSSDSSDAPASTARPIPPPRVQKLGPADSASRPDERVLIEGEGLKARAAEPSSSASATLSASAEKAKDIVQEVLPQTAAQPKEPVGFFGRINQFTYQVLDYLDPLPLSSDPEDPLMKCFLSYCLPTLRNKYQKELIEQIPDHHKKAIIAAHLAASLVYKRGLHWFPSIVDILPIVLKET